MIPQANLDHLEKMMQKNKKVKKQLKTFAAKVNKYAGGDKKKSDKLFTEYKDFLLKDAIREAFGIPVASHPKERAPP